MHRCISQLSSHVWCSLHVICVHPQKKSRQVWEMAQVSYNSLDVCECGCKHALRESSKTDKANMTMSYVLRLRINGQAFEPRMVAVVGAPNFMSWLIPKTRRMWRPRDRRLLVDFQVMNNAAGSPRSVRRRLVLSAAGYAILYSLSQHRRFVIQHCKMTFSLAQTGCRGVVFRRAHSLRGAAVQQPRTRRQSMWRILQAQKTETSNTTSKDITETGGKVSIYSEQ